MIKTVYVCDVCGGERKEANHWFTARTTESGRLFITPWHLGADEKESSHLCGQGCVHSFVDGFLSASQPSADSSALS